MTNRKTRQHPSWSDIKTHISTFDRAGLIELIRSLYDASSDNRRFLHSRFGAGDGILEPYKKSLERWLWPDVLKPSQDVSVSKALKAISDYKKAVGKPEGLLELMVFYCELAAGFTLDVGMEGDSWFNSFIRVFQDAVKLALGLPEDQQGSYIKRLEKVLDISRNFGWGVGDALGDIWAESGADSA